VRRVEILCIMGGNVKQVSLCHPLCCIPTVDPGTFYHMYIDQSEQLKLSSS